jgi:hypothetical protein
MVREYPSRVNRTGREGAKMGLPGGGQSQKGLFLPVLQGQEAGHDGGHPERE